MPEYLPPGVYVEETSFRHAPIAGVETGTAGFVGPARYGPVGGQPSLVTSFKAFQRIYGGEDRLRFGSARRNDLARAARAFFDEGGRRLYVSRVFNDRDGDHRACWPPPAGPPPPFSIHARYPGAAGNLGVLFRFELGADALGRRTDDPPGGQGVPTLRGVDEHDVVLAALDDTAEGIELFEVEGYRDPATGEQGLRLRRAAPTDGGCGGESAVVVAPSDPRLREVRRLTVSVAIDPLGRDLQGQTWDALAFDPAQPAGLGVVFREQPDAETAAPPIVFRSDRLTGASALRLAEAMLARPSLIAGDSSGGRGRPATVADGLRRALQGQGASAEARSFRVQLAGGADGGAPRVRDYRGRGGAHPTGLRALERVPEIAIVAAPGVTGPFLRRKRARRILQHLLAHCERIQGRVAVIDSGRGMSPDEVLDMRSGLDSSWATLYYPWVHATDPLTGKDILLPPSGFVAGIWARTDHERGVHLAPANEVIRSAVGLERRLSRGDHERLNVAGVNCLRFFEGRGYRVFGARTLSSDPEWKYLSVRRYFAYLERSIDQGLRWAVFEPNGEPLWSEVRRAVEAFLLAEWQGGRLPGNKPEHAFFVRCDRSTMTPSDIDRGRIVCLVGVAPTRPAEFVTFRIGLATADAG